MTIRMATIAARALACAMAAGVVAGCNTAPSGPEAPSFYQRLDEGGQLDPQAAASLINTYRARKGLGPLALDPGLSEEARRRASTMAASDTSSWGEMPTLVAARGGGGERLERVSAGYRTLAEAFSGWRDSPQHEKVMLAASGTRLGIAAVDRPGTKYRVYWAIVVAGPA